MLLAWIHLEPYIWPCQRRNEIVMLRGKEPSVAGALISGADCVPRSWHRVSSMARSCGSVSDDAWPKWVELYISSRWSEVGLMSQSHGLARSVFQARSTTITTSASGIFKQDIDILPTLKSALPVSYTRTDRAVISMPRDVIDETGASISQVASDIP